MSQKTKQIIFAIIIIIAAFVGYKMLFVDEESSSPALVSSDTNQAVIADGQKILLLLNKLAQVDLDDSIFTNAVFVSLESFERSLEDQTAGRKNPFLPIGVDNSSVLLRVSTSSRAR